MSLLLDRSLPSPPLHLRHRQSWSGRILLSPPSSLQLICKAASLKTETTLAYIPAAPILLPEGPWKQVEGGVTAAKGFKAAGLYGGLRAKGDKPDLALVACEVDATAAGKNITPVVSISGRHRN